ncbi:response regulator transcription factor [Paucibacter sp. APW11]|uniref:Response regulator transcription factor n=1 Tax=Roseateles aquae TaxID=3077235 RepID=A0ABU3PGN9_9BURK|nr:response regulator transcription factor [Paucibacter sp. APW11]MDT9001704.1 response regulator transcription factor [Paucibacter sp. APW11]
MRIAIVDDHQLVSAGLAALLRTLRPGLDCRTYCSLSQLLEQLPAHGSPALVLLDLGLPDGQGVQTLSRLREQLDAVPVIVVTADERRETVLACLELGAFGFIPKTADAELLLSRFAAALEGCIQLPGNWTDPAPQSAQSTSEMFSERQHEVLQLLLRGMSNKSICRVLQMSESTLKTHLGVIFRKLGVGRRAEAMVMAMKLGIRLELVDQPALSPSTPAALATPEG